MIKFKRIRYSDLDLMDRLAGMTLRKADIDEMKAVTGLNNTWAALKSAVRNSTEWTEISYDDETGEIITLFGLGSFRSGAVKPCLHSVGIPWMVASPNLYKHKKLFMRYSKKIIKEMLDQFPLIANYVDSRNTLHIRWLKHMGFKFTGELQEINGVMFKHFYMKRSK